MLSPLKPTTLSTRRDSNWRILLIFAIFWTAFSLFWEYGVITGGAPWIMAVFGLPFIAIGVGMLWASAIPLILGTKLADPQILVDRNPLRVGETFSFNYTQPVKGTLIVQSLSTQLIFRETARYTRGTDTTTENHDVIHAVFKQAGQTYQAGQVIGEYQTVTLPADGMHSFVASDNQLRWYLKIDLLLPGWPDFKVEYEILVLPERV